MAGFDPTLEVDYGGNLVRWNHGGDACDRGTFQEAATAYIRSGLRIVLHDCALHATVALRLHSAAVIGTKFCAISRFCSMMRGSSAPEMVRG